ncbi:hypothetical protein N7490_001808 [Penicillium lividum]|nr:hypothetical protein N7490_001808 [Penicillium lividum]
MVRSQRFDGEFRSEAHQLNGNNIYGPVYLSAPNGRDRHHPKSSQSTSKPSTSGYSYDEANGISELGKSGTLNWDDCAQSLAFDESNDRERIIEPQSPGTCEWLLKSPEYLRWIDERGLLLIRGKPGCGKSTLMKFSLGQQMEAADPSEFIVLSFFFFANGTELQSSMLGFLRSLLLQLLEKDEHSRSAFMNVYRRHCKLVGREKPQFKWHQAELEDHFQKFVADCSARRKILIFVDAVDECRDSERHRLIGFCHNICGRIRERPNRPGVFVTCRPYPDSQIKADFQIRLEEQNHNDISNFVEQSLRLPDETPTDADELKRMLLSKAEGLFLWLVLIIPQIHDMSGKGSSLRKIQSEILECPQELDGLYEGLLRKVEENELLEAIALFQWICFAARPLSLEELRIAMTVHLSGPKGSLREYEDGDNPRLISNESKMRKRMIHLSRGLVDTASAQSSEGKAVVGFHHDTIRDFMLRKGLNYLNGRLHDHRSLAKDASVQLANTCLRYLSTDEIRVACLEKAMRSKRKFGFLVYTAIYWLSHAVTAERENLGEEIAWPTEAVLRLWVNACEDLEDSLTQNATRGTSLMHIAAEHGLHGLAKRILCANEEKASTLQNGRQARPNGNSRAVMKAPSRKMERKSGPHKEIPVRSPQIRPKPTQETRAWRKPEKALREPKERTRSTYGMDKSKKGAHSAVEDGSEAEREKRKVRVVNMQNERGDSPLHLAAENGFLDMIVILYQWGGKITQTNCDGYTPLYRGSQNGHLEVVKFLYGHGADANIHTATDHGWTPFSAASDSGHLEVVKFLYEHGADADIHIATNDGWTPLSAASDSGHLEVVKFLYEHGADADIHTATNDGQTPIFVACRSGHLEAVKFLYERGADTDIHTVTNNGWTPFSAASDSGHLEVVKFLYEHGADADIHTVTNKGWTPFSAASDSGHLEIVKFLYEHGADADIHTATNDGQTPIFVACRSGHLEAVKFLYERGADADIHTATNDGWNPFCAACRSGHLEVVEFLYERGADADIHTATNNGWTPIHVACHNGHLEVVKFLYEHGADADIHTATNDGQTPIFVACRSGHLEAVKFLYERGADADIHTATNDGWNPFCAACRSGHLEVVEFLYGHGADADIHTATNNGWTPIHVACHNGHLEVVKFLYKHGLDANIRTATNDGWNPFCAACRSGHLEVVEFLYEHGADADIHTATNNGWTPIHVACHNGHLEVVKFLYKHGADANIHIATNNGWTPFSAASDSGHLEVVKSLYEHGADADIHIATNDGWTPLSAASDSGHLEIVKFLYEHGADIDVHTATKDGQTPIYAACRNGHLEVVKFLYEHGADTDIHTVTNNGWTPFSAASESGHLEVVKFLYEHGAVTDIHTTTNDGQSPMYAACRNGHLEVVKFLYDHCADVDIDRAMRNGWTPLHAASGNGHLEIVRLLCDHGASTEARDISGRTSLFIACALGHVEVAQLLLSRGAVVDTNDRYGSTPIFAAVRKGHDKAATYLLGLQDAYIQFEDGFGHTLVWWARKSGNTTLIEAVIQNAQKRGIQISETDLAVKTSSMSMSGSARWCDLCIRFFSDGSAYHQCSICRDGDFNICVECFEMGARCLNSSHELSLHEPTHLEGPAP